MDVERPLPGPTTARIAGRMRALRTEHGLSLEQLAEKAGVSRSMLSLIERGESSPTAVVLDKVASGFGVPVAVFFEEPTAKADPLCRATSRQPWCDPQTGYLREVLSPPGITSPFQLVQVTFPPGATIQYEGSSRARSYHQQIWIQEGRIEVSYGSNMYRLEEGDCLAMEVDGRPTSLRNPTRKRARYALVIMLC